MKIQEMKDVVRGIAADWQLHQGTGGRGADGKPWGWQWGGQTVFDQLTGLAGPHICGRVLEIGCGGGKWTKWLCDVADEVVAIDVQAVAIEQSREYEPRAIYQLTDGESLPFPGDSFDVVFTFDTFQHLPPSLVMRYLLEARRVSQAVIFDLVDVTTRKGGISLMQYVANKAWRRVYTYGYYNFYAPDQIKAMLHLAGWEPALLGHVGAPNPRDIIYLGVRRG